MDTLCAQAWGAREYLLLGTILQRCLLLLALLCIPISLLWLFVEPLLVAARQVREWEESHCSLFTV